MADDLAGLLGDKFQQGVSVGAKGGNEVSFVALAEGGRDDRVDRGLIRLDRPPYHHAPIFCASW